MRQQKTAGYKRLLKLYTNRLRTHIETAGSSNDSYAAELKTKIGKLLDELRYFIKGRELRRIMGALAVSFGLIVSQPILAQSFASPVENPFGLASTNGYAATAFADLDGDGDQDLMVGEHGGHLQYFENTGNATSPQFAAPVIDPFGFTIPKGRSITFPTFVDLDADGDLDLFVGSHDDFYYWGQPLSFYENTGSSANPQFASPVANPFGITPPSGVYVVMPPTFADLDDDGDQDLLTGNHGGNMVYYENTGSPSLAQFGLGLSNPFGLDSVYYKSAPQFIDIDKDGDYDLIVGEYDGDFGIYEANFNYFQNTGTRSNPQFAAPGVNPFGLSTLYQQSWPAFADLDADGDMDLLAGEYDGKMWYFENTSPIGLKDFGQSSNFQIYPSPARDYLEISTDQELSKIELVDHTGRLIEIWDPSPSGRISVAHLNKGVYLLKIINVNGEETISKFHKR